MTISLDSWKEGHVSPTTLAVRVQEGKALPAQEIIAQMQPILEPRLQATLSGYKNGVRALAFSPDGITLAAGPPIKLWDATTGKERATLASEDSRYVTSVAFSPHGRTLAIAHSEQKNSKANENGKSVDRVEFDGVVRLWDVSTARLLQTLGDGGGEWIGRVAFESDGAVLAAYESRPERHGLRSQVCFWDVSAGRRRRVLQVGQGRVAFAPNEKTFATVGEEIRLWDAATGKPLALLPTVEKFYAIHTLTFAPDSRGLAACDGSGRIFFWDVPSRSLRALLQHGSGELLPNALAFSPDSRVLAVGLNEPRSAGVRRPKIVLWDTTALRELGTLAPPPGLVLSLAFSPDGRRLAAGGIENVLLWDVDRLRADK